MGRWVEAIATKSNDAKVVVDFLKSNIFYQFGMLKVLISDQVELKDERTNSTFQVNGHQIKLFHEGSTPIAIVQAGSVPTSTPSRPDLNRLQFGQSRSSVGVTPGDTARLVYPKGFKKKNKEKKEQNKAKKNKEATKSHKLQTKIQHKAAKQEVWKERPVKVWDLRWVFLRLETIDLGPSRKSRSRIERPKVVRGDHLACHCTLVDLILNVLAIGGEPSLFVHGNRRGRRIH
ncbi:hypothetical protein CR513_21962, partial [Mucuna pruriens]